MAKLKTKHIEDDAVTYAKMQNVTTDERILGRISGADGVIEELTKANVLTMLNISTIEHTNALFVAKNGNDSNGGKRIDEAKLTIQAAVTAGASGDTVYVFDGDYDEAITLKNGVDIVAFNPENTTILRQVGDNNVECHCYLNININNNNTDETYGLYIQNGNSVIKVIGDITGSDGDNEEFSAGYGVYNWSSGTIEVTGNIIGGNNSLIDVEGAAGVYNYSTGTIKVIGDITGGNGTNDADGGKGVYNESTGTIKVIGDITGGNGTNDGGRGVYNYGAGTINVIGDITGGAGNYDGYGIYNYSTGTVIVKNGTIKNLVNYSASHSIVNNGTLTLQDCKILCTHADAKSIYSNTAQDVTCMNVQANRDDHANITQLIPSGFTFDDTIDGIKAKDIESTGNVAGATYGSDGTVSDAELKDAVTHKDVTTGNPHSVTKTNVVLSNVDDVQQMPLSYLDTDVTLAANSDTKVPSQKASKTYIDLLLAANDAMVYKGVIDCSANPNYPAADAGHTYRISVAGKIGGASGVVVEAGDLILCINDSTASGDQATVGIYWNIVQVNIDGAVIGPASSVDSNLVAFDGITGKLIKDSSVTTANVSDAITKKHTQNTDTDLDSTFEDTFVKKVDTVNVLSDITSAGADIEDAVTKKHAEAHDIASHSDTSATGSELNTLTDDSMADALHRHSELSASDGTPNPALSVDAAGNVGIGTTAPGADLHIASATNGDEQKIKMSFEATTAGKMSSIMLGAGNVNVFKSKIAHVREGRYGVGRLGFFTSPTDTGEEDSTVERMSIDRNGNVGIGTTSPTEALDINSDKIRIRTANTPASASATGAVGEICWDADYIYVCTATDTWKRTAIATW